MAKRLVDTEIFQKKWYRELPLKMKSVWTYLFLRCNHAGIWEVDLDLMSFQIGAKITEDEIKQHLGKRIHKMNEGSKWYIPKFVDFQYGELNPKVKVHLSVMKILEKYDLSLTVTEPLSKGLERVKDKDKDKVKDKVKDTQIENLKSLESIDDAFLNELQDKHLDIDVPFQFEKFSDNLKATGKTFKDYRSAFRNWLKSPYCDKTDKIRLERHKSAEKQAKIKRNKEIEDNSASDEEIKKELDKAISNLSRKYQV